MPDICVNIELRDCVGCEECIEENCEVREEPYKK